MGARSKQQALALRDETAREHQSLTIAQAAKRLGWNSRTVANYADELGLGHRFRSTGGKGGGTRLFTNDDVERLGQVELARERVEEFRALKRRLGLLDIGDAADRLRVTTRMVHVYVKREILKPEQVTVIAGVRYRMFAPSEVDRFERQWATGRTGRRLRWQDPDFVVRRYRGRGDLARLAESLGVDEEQAEAHLRGRVEARGRDLRQRRKGPERAAYHSEWRTLYEQLREELIADYRERESLGLLDRFEHPPGVWRICEAAAEHDFREHRERWLRYRSAPGDPEALHPADLRKAAQRVYKALKPASLTTNQ